VGVAADSPEAAVIVVDEEASQEAADEVSFCIPRRSSAIYQKTAVFFSLAEL
jgi:hypothetical protein